MYLLQVDPAHNRLHPMLPVVFGERQAEKPKDERVVRISELTEGFLSRGDMLLGIYSVDPPESIAEASWNGAKAYREMFFQEAERTFEEGSWSELP